MSGRRRRARLGQHFLRDERVLERIVDAVPDAPEAIIEVGAGDGVLTERLAELDRPLVSVELDEGMAYRARRRLTEPDRSNARRTTDVWTSPPRNPGSARLHRPRPSAISKRDKPNLASS